MLFHAGCQRERQSGEYTRAIALDLAMHTPQKLLGTHGRTGLGRLLMSNTPESVLPEANCPGHYRRVSYESAGGVFARAGRQQGCNRHLTSRQVINHITNHVEE